MKASILTELKGFEEKSFVELNKNQLNEYKNILKNLILKKDRCSSCIWKIEQVCI